MKSPIDTPLAGPSLPFRVASLPHANAPIAFEFATSVTGAQPCLLRALP
jgi:hypothetical protein